MNRAGLLNRLARPFVVVVERHYPDPIIFLIILTGVAFVMALGLTETTLTEAAWAWGGNLSSLLAFTTQMCLILVTGHALAHTDASQRILKSIAQLPRNEAQAYAVATLTSGISSLIAWGLGMVAGALMARELAKVGEDRGWRLHYPLLVASAFCGNLVWHMGYSGSAPLFVATDGHAMQDLVGIIPVTETVLTPWNISAALVTLTTVALICPLMRPATNDAVVVGRDGLGNTTETESTPNSKGLGDTLNNARAFSLLLSLGVLSYIALWFGREGFSLNLDVVIWTFLGLGLLLARSPVHYAKLFGNACQTIGPILLQFPFYAAIMGLLADSGLADVISAWFASVATEYTLPFWGFLAGGLINMFVPSGGGQWAIQGPVFLQAAAELGTDPALIVMSIAYGDQWTNLIQPFWAIPMLVIAGLSVRDIMGFSFVLFLISFVIFTATILLVPLFF